MTAFGEAYKRGYLARNPVALAKPPRIEETEVVPFEPDELGRILSAAMARRNGVRFVIALALGLRQGEASVSSGHACTNRAGRSK